MDEINIRHKKEEINHYIEPQTALFFFKMHFFFLFDRVIPNELTVFAYCTMYMEFPCRINFFFFFSLARAVESDSRSIFKCVVCQFQTDRCCF